VSVQLIAPCYSSARLFAAVSRILSANTLCSMATRSEAGELDINAAFYSFTPELELYFLSNPASAHCRNLAQVGHTAVVVCDSHQEWGEPHAGLQLYGTGGPVPPAHTERVRASYAARFSRYSDFVARAGEAVDLATGFASLRFYLFVPTWMKILDEREFGDEVYVTAKVAV
jgi:hypothetical protein